MLGAPWWVTALAGVGVLALATGVVTLFFALGRRPESLSVDSRPEVGSDQFLRGVAGSMNAPLLRGGTARLLDNGVEIFPALLKALSGAERSINFMVYIWEPGRVSDRIFDVLLERQRAGVEVRLMLDGMGGRTAPEDRLEALRAAGGKVQWFHPLRFGRLLRFHKRNHRRAIVIDGTVGFTGGAAVGDRWLGDADDAEHWRDQMVEVHGCLAANLQSGFTQLWANVCGEVLVGDAFYPPEDEREEGAGEELSRHVHVLSSPAEASHPLRTFFWVSFACARERIWLASPYFVPDEGTRAVLVERARAGVDVRLLLPGEETDAGAVRRAGHSYYRKLLEAGVRIFEYRPTMMHAKSLVIDGKWSVVGSANMDIRSKELNQESVIGMLDRGFGAQLERTFEADLRDCEEIALDRWLRRPLRAKIAERFWVLFAEQY